MTFCGKCGNKLEEGTMRCPSCGASVEMPKEERGGQSDFTSKIGALNETADTTAEFDAADINQNKGMAILAYLGILVLIPIFAANGSKFARYHANQGLVLLITEVLYGIAYGILSAIIMLISWRLAFLVSLIGLVGIVFLVLLIIGIMNAANGKAKELPIIGKIRLLK